MRHNQQALAKTRLNPESIYEVSRQQNPCRVRRTESCQGGKKHSSDRESVEVTTANLYGRFMKHFSVYHHRLLAYYIYRQWIPDCFFSSCLCFCESITYVFRSVKCHVIPFNLLPLFDLSLLSSHFCQQNSMVWSCVLEPADVTFSFPRECCYRMTVRYSFPSNTVWICL